MRLNDYGLVETIAETIRIHGEEFLSDEQAKRFYHDGDLRDLVWQLVGAGGSLAAFGWHPCSCQTKVDSAVEAIA